MEEREGGRDWVRKRGKEGRMKGGRGKKKGIWAEGRQVGRGGELVSLKVAIITYYKLSNLRPAAYSFMIPMSRNVHSHGPFETRGSCLCLKEVKPRNYVTKPGPDPNHRTPTGH